MIDIALGAAGLIAGIAVCLYVLRFKPKFSELDMNSPGRQGAGGVGLLFAIPYALLLVLAWIGVYDAVTWFITQLP